jgi:hypothetical protein
MGDSLRFTTLWASTACYKENFTLLLHVFMITEEGHDDYTVNNWTLYSFEWQDKRRTGRKGSLSN